MQSCGELTSGTGSTVESTAANAAHAVMLDVAHDQSPGRSVEHQADNDVKTLSNHFSILDSSSASGPVLSLGRCLVQGCCSNMVHCPFCDRQQYKPTQPARVRDHLYLSHFQHAVYFEGWMMVKCFHKCRDPDPRGGHYHCPSCSTTLLKRNAFTQHLISHARKQGLDPKTVHAPDAKQPAVIHFEGHKILLCREKCSETLSAHYHCPLCRQTSMRLASLTSHLWRCKKRAIAVKKGDESEETTSMAELFSSEMVASVTHPRDLPQLKWHLSIVRNLSDLPLTRCLKPACCKGRYHCPLCTTSKLKPNYLCHMRQHFVSHWRTGVPYEDYTVLVCYLSCEVPHRAPRPRFHYHCPLCGDTRRRKEAFARHLVNCDPSQPQPMDAQVLGSRSEDEDDDDEEELPNHAGTAGTLIQLASMQHVDQVKVQGAGAQGVGADQAKLQAAESLADMNRISVQSMGHSCISRPLKQLNEHGNGSCESARTDGPSELHQCSDLMIPSEQKGCCVLSEDGSGGALKAASQNIAKEMQSEQTPVGERLVSLQNSTIQLFAGENDSSVMSECEQRERVTLFYAHHKKQVDSHIETNIINHEEQKDLHHSPEIDADVSHEASGNAQCLREGHTPEVIIPLSPCIASNNGEHRAQEMLTAESMESSSQKPGTVYTALNLPSDDQKEAESEKEALTSMQVDDDGDIQVFKQVTTQVAQSTVSRLECLGELEASLQVIKKLCGVTWQQSGCTITMSSCLDSLCHAEEYLKQIVKGGLQAFLQTNSMSQTSTNIHPLPLGGKTSPRKRGRPRGSKNKHTLMRTDEYTPFYKQPKILTISSEKLESSLSRDTTATLSGMYASRTRGKRINFAQLHAGSLSPPPSPSQDEQFAATQRQEQEGKKRRGRPRKILIQAEGSNEMLPSEGKGADIDNMKQRRIVCGDQGLQLCSSEENAKFSSSCIPSGHLKGVQSNGSDNHQQETMSKFDAETTLFCTPSTASAEGCALEGGKFANALTSLLEVVKDNKADGCDSTEQTTTENEQETNQTENQIDHNGLSIQTLTEVENGGRSNSPCFQLLSATPNIKREQYKTRTKGNDFVFIPSIIFTYSKDDTIHDSLGGQNEMGDNIVSETEDITLEGSFPAEKTQGNKISAGCNNTLKKIASSEMCNAVNKDNLSSELKDIARNQNASCPRLTESSEKPQKRDAMETSGKVSPHHLPCPLCIIITSTYSQMCDHLAKQHPTSPPLTCEVCELVCVTPFALAFHVERKHGPQLCPVSSSSAHTCFCGKVCGSITSLKWHQSFVHKVDSHRRGPMRLTCGLCSYKASDSWDMRHHRELHRGRPNTCPVCHKKLSSEAAIKVHMAAIHSNSKFSCHICSKSFAHIRYLKSHVRRHGGEKRHECGICGWRFHETNTLRAHLDTHKPREQRTYSFTCPYCPAAYNNRANLRDHLNKHTGDKPHICRLCNKGFAFRSMLTTHHAFVHSSERPHSCQLCPKKFKTKMQLQQHMVIHTGTSNHTCQKCGRAMPTASRLRVHARRCKGNSVSKQIVFQAQSTAVNIVTPSQTVNIFQKATLGQGSRLSVIPGHDVHLVQAGIGQAQTLTLVPIHQLLPGTAGAGQKRVVLVSSKGQAAGPVVQTDGRETMSKSDHINNTYISVSDPTVQTMGSKLVDSVNSTENSINSLQQLPGPGQSHQGSSFVTINRAGLQSHQAISSRCDSSLNEGSAQEDFNAQVSGTSVLTRLQASAKGDDTVMPLVLSESPHVISANHTDVVGVPTEAQSNIAAEDRRASHLTLSNSETISVDNSMSSAADVHQVEMQALVLPSDLLNQEVFIIEGDGSQHLISLANIQFVSAEEGEHQQRTGFISHLDHTVSIADNSMPGVLPTPCAASSLSSLQDDSGHNTLTAEQLLTEDENEAGKMTLFMCSMCDQTFADQASAEQHVMVQHEVEVDNT